MSTESTATAPAATSGVQRHHGSCHCGAVRFTVELNASHGSQCNCSICTKTNYVGSIVKPAAFTLETPEDALGVYAWGAKISVRHFCKTCGVQCFARGHLAQLGGDYVSVNLVTLDGVELSALKVRHWDGRHNNWYAGMRDTPWPMLTPTAAS